jgi:hypothetical protein
MSEYLEKQEDGSYKLVLRGDACKADDIKVPNGADILAVSSSNKRAWFSACGGKQYSGGYWHDCGVEDSEGATYNNLDKFLSFAGGGKVIWQRSEEKPVSVGASSGGSQWDIQVGGNHYKDMKIQPAKFALENKLDYCQANAIKYICRHEHKNGKQDLEKAKHYIDLLIEHYYGDS